MRLEVKIVIDDNKADIQYKGIWTRRFVDIAYKNMLLRLPVHMAKIRQSEKKGE